MKIKVLKSEPIDFIGKVYNLEKIDDTHWKAEDGDIIIDRLGNLELLYHENSPEKFYLPMSAAVFLDLECEGNLVWFEEVEFIE